MKIKFQITDELIHKFNILMQNELGRTLTAVYIEDLGNEYRFGYKDSRDNGGGWHFELDKFDKNSGMFTLKCSTRMLEVPLNHIKDLKTFCSYIAQVRQLQLDYLNKK
jgi:hypothetical protein